MREISWWSLIVLRQFLFASGRLFAIMLKTRPQQGFPTLRAYLDLCERLAADQHADTVAPALREFIAAIEDRCPGVTRALFPGPGDRRDLHHGDRVGPATETTAEGVDG